MYLKYECKPGSNFGELGGRISSLALQLLSMKHIVNGQIVELVCYRRWEESFCILWKVVFEQSSQCCWKMIPL